MRVSCEQHLSCAKGAPTSLLGSPPGRGTFLDELRILGIVEFIGLVAPPLLPSGDVGSTLACSLAHLPAFSGSCLVFTQGAFALLLLSPSFRAGVLDVSFSIRRGSWGDRAVVFLRRARRGVCVPFPPPPAHSLRPCRPAYSFMKTCARTFCWTLPTPRRCRCSQRCLSPRRFDARDFVLHQLKKECRRLRASCRPAVA